MIKLGIDLMGGDQAPSAVLRGLDLVWPHLKEDTGIVLYGTKESLANVLDYDRLEKVVCSDYIAMDEHPVKALQRKKDSTLVRAFADAASQKISAVASAGHSGAIMVASMQFLGLVDGISRPVVISVFPKLNDKPLVVLDVGINVDCKPEQFLEFAKIGSLYAEKVLGIAQPKVALLNSGTEKTKGNLLYQKAHSLLADYSVINWIGNLETRDLFDNEADVLLCDGFTGNIVLKQAEAFFSLSQKLGMEHPFLQQLNYESHGGSPILGVKGNVILAHGASGPEAIKNMILSAESIALANFVSQLSSI
jgi:glycerol-3-phosphate acyltransferase PlsX